MTAAHVTDDNAALPGGASGRELRRHKESPPVMAGGEVRRGRSRLATRPAALAAYVSNSPLVSHVQAPEIASNSGVTLPQRRWWRWRR